MPKNLKRYYGRGDLHFVTFSYYRRIPLLRTIGNKTEVKDPTNSVSMTNIWARRSKTRKY
jgi:hypothetical protein